MTNTVLLQFCWKQWLRSSHLSITPSHPRRGDWGCYRYIESNIDSGGVAQLWGTRATPPESMEEGEIIPPPSHSSRWLGVSGRWLRCSHSSWFSTKLKNHKYTKFLNSDNIFTFSDLAQTCFSSANNRVIHTEQTWLTAYYGVIHTFCTTIPCNIDKIHNTTYWKNDSYKVIHSLWKSYPTSSWTYPHNRKSHVDNNRYPLKNKLTDRLLPGYPHINNIHPYRLAPDQGWN